MTAHSSPQLYLSPHAEQRMRTRRISPRDVLQVLLFGRVLPSKRKRIIKVLGESEVNRYRQEHPLLRKLRGLTVVFDRVGQVITAYRDRRADRPRRPVSPQPVLPGAKT